MGIIPQITKYDSKLSIEVFKNQHFLKAYKYQYQSWHIIGVFLFFYTADLRPEDHVWALEDAYAVGSKFKREFFNDLKNEVFPK